MRPGAASNTYGSKRSLSQARRGARRVLVSLLAAATVTLAGGTGTAFAAAGCDKVASPQGSDSAPGTESQPYRTVQKLGDSLSAGQTGCLRAGTFSESVKLTHAGAPGAPITITSFPGERGKLVGRLWVSSSADHVTVSNLDLNGSNSSLFPSPQINADDVKFDGNDVTNDNTAICFVVGSASYGHATGAQITRNRIHHCGRLPAWNHDHGIYVEDATGTRITENYIYDNADRGIQFYPDAQDSYAARNVIDGNGQGVIFAGGDEGQGYVASRNNVVEFNVITNAKLRYNVEAYWDGTPGSGNVARNNCVHGGAQGDIQSPQVGFTAANNLVADPHYVNRAAKDFRLAPDSPCASVLAGAAPPPAGSAPGAGSAPSQPCAASRRKRCSRLRLVSLRVRSIGRGRVLLTGKVAASHRRSARRAAVQLERSKRWRTVAKLRVNRRGRFAVRLRSGAARASSLLRLRAVVRGVGASRTASVRVKR